MISDPVLILDYDYEQEQESSVRASSFFRLPRRSLVRRRVICHSLAEP
jgi:hypothetical protein